MQNKFNFTKRSLESLSLPEMGKRFYFYDTKSHGLAISERASCLLGISRNTLRKKLFNYQINSAMYKGSQDKRSARGNV